MAEQFFCGRALCSGVGTLPGRLPGIRQFRRRGSSIGLSGVALLGCFLKCSIGVLAKAQPLQRRFSRVMRLAFMARLQQLVDARSHCRFVGRHVIVGPGLSRFSLGYRRADQNPQAGLCAGDKGQSR